ncbi:MAG: hypothetical protein ACE5KM_08425, partial [Planctomycetaceae bacterium]
ILVARKHLSHVKWAETAGYQLRTANSYVYAKDWKPVDADKAVRFKPFAMVWMQKGRKPGETPITIVADSAYVQFVRKFDVTNPDPGRVIGGSLEGEVEIRGPNGMTVIGSNFVFSEEAMRLWSDDPIRFTYGVHRGRAVGLQCELLEVEGPARAGRFRVGGFQSIRLRRDVVMNFLFRGSRKGDLAGKDESLPSTAALGTKKKPQPVQIRSKGSFEFGVQTNVATFEDDVKVFRAAAPGKLDTLLCDLLTLVFERDEKNAGKKSDAPSGPQTPGERFRTIDSKLAFRRLRAQPRAPRRHVVLISPNNNLTAHMNDLIHDAQSNVTVLRDPEAVQVVHEDSRMQAPEITLVQDRKGDATTLFCKGAGWIRHFDKQTGRRDFSANWKKSLRKYPDPASDLDVIDLEQDVALLRPQDASELQAQFVRIWMDRRKKRRPADNVSAKSPATPGGITQRVRLRRMLALNRVTMTSPDMRTYTKRLEVWFDHSPPLSKSARSRSGLVSAVRRVQRVSRRRVTRSALPAAPIGSRSPSGAAGPAYMASVDGPPFGPADEVEKGVPPMTDGRGSPRVPKDDGPLQVWADLVRVLVAPGRGRQAGQVREVWTLGRVQVKQDHRPGEAPLRINGDKMHILNRTKTDQVLHVYGKPAHIRDRKMHIEGNQVHLDRGKNRSWVDGKGLLQLPVDKTLDGRKLQTPQILDVWWRKNMTFDGDTARFRGQVRGVVEDSRIRCEELDVVMSERVEFGRRRRGSPESKVKQIVCRDNVQFESYEYEENKLIQIRKGRVRNLTVDQLTGDTDAKGPGWVAVWRRGGGGRRARFGGPGLVRSNRAASRPRKSEWDYTRIDFADRSQGNFQKRYTRFRNRVDVVYGPVQRPPHVIDPDELPDGGGWMRCRELLVTQFAKTETQPAFMTLRGEGNSEVEGMKFHARADTITYNELRDLYVLRSLGRRDATIWRQTEVGGERSRFVAQRMEFVPSRNSLKFDKAKRLDGLR